MTVNPHLSQTTAGKIHLLAAVLLGNYSFCFKAIHLNDSCKVTSLEEHSEITHVETQSHR